MDVSNPVEDDGSAVQDAALWLHRQPTAVDPIVKLGPVHLRERNRKFTSGVHQSDGSWVEGFVVESTCKQTLTVEKEVLVWTSSRVGAPWLQNRK